MRFKYFALSFLVFLTLFNFQATAQVWKNQNEWSTLWEERYSAWVQKSWHRHKFATTHLEDGSPNPYYGLKMDCADTVYAMRIIFSYENKLPFVVVDPTSPRRRLSNEMGRWNHQRDEIKRLHHFIHYMFNMLSTRSLPTDTYPVALNLESIRPGQLILTTPKNHHSWTIKDVLPMGVPWLVFNSRIGAGSSLVLQERKSWPNPYWFFEGNPGPTGHAGIRAFKWPEHLGLPTWEVPGYSEEQYQIPIEKWLATAQKRLAVSIETADQELDRLLQTVCEGISSRVTVVNEALYHFTKNPHCMTYEQYDNYSTPNRDRRVYDDLRALRQGFAKHIAGNTPFSEDLKQKLFKVFPQPLKHALIEHADMPPATVDALSLCPVTYDLGKTIDLAEFKRRLFSGMISNDPHEGIAYRWGESRGPGPDAKKCQGWDYWSPKLEDAEL